MKRALECPMKHQPEICGRSEAVGSFRRGILGAGFLLLTLSGQAISADITVPASGQEMVEQWKKNPYRHSHVADFSFAGYGGGEKPLPEPQAVANVRDFGAKGDGQSDDTAAFREAIGKAKAAGGGAVFVPAGEYMLSGVLALDAPGLVLRGAGADKSVLHFTKSLRDVAGPFTLGRSSRWSWAGGLIWIGPPGTFTADGKMARTKPGWEDWWENQPLATVTAAAAQGEVAVTVDKSAALKAGDFVLFCWKDPDDRSLLRAIAGSEAMAGADWGGLAGTTFRWPVRIAKVEGSRVTLAQPLRLAVRPEWQVHITSPGPHVSECGVEHLAVRFPEHKAAAHLQDAGFNGIFLNNTINCFVRDVALHHADNGILLNAAKHCTMTGFVISGGANHHATYTARSADNLFQNFHIESKPAHGINTEGLSSGNVWRNGEMRHGAFDSHCALSFDLLRENIRVFSDGSPGGAGKAGPFLGRRAVHWNITLTGGSSEWCFAPAYLPDGAIVGGQGGALFTRDTKLWHMPDGPKNCRVVDFGQETTPASLYEAQFIHRTGRKPNGPPAIRK